MLHPSLPRLHQLANVLWRRDIDGRAFVVRVVAMLIALAVALGHSDFALAQRDPAAKELIDGMFQTLLDAQNNSRSQPLPRRSDSRPASAEIQELRGNLSSFAQSVSQLVQVLYRDVDRTSGIRPLIGEALQLNATATTVARRSVSHTSVDGIASDFEELDQRWRLLSFRLQELRDLSQSARAQLDRATQYHDRLARQLDVSPQMDRDAIVRQTSSLATEITRLLEDIDYEIFDGSRRYELLVEGRRVYQQCRRVATIAARGTIEETRREYRTYAESWKPFVDRVRELNVRYIDRQLQRVQSADRQLQDLLMMHAEMDRSELLYLTQLLQRDLDQLMDGVTLRDLTRLRRGRDTIVDRASEFYSACGDFADCLRNGDSNETMADLYSYLDNNWSRVAEVLQQTELPEARQVYRQLERSMGEIRAVLSVEEDRDPHRMVELAANLENLATHLDHDIRSVLASRPNNFDRQFRQQSIELTQNFKSLANRLHSQLVSNHTPSQVRETIVMLSRRWNNLQPVIDRLPRQDRDHLLVVRRQVPPVLVELQTLLTL